MTNLLDITVEDILKKGSFENVKVISGEEGLKNVVKWTHIIESERFINYLNGGELILTTGIGLDSEPNANASFIEQLIKKEVAAICIEIEIGNQFRNISPEIIKLSNEKNIPIIIFPGIVKFVDITQEIHQYIVHHHYQVMNRLYTLSKEFNALSLLPNGILKILEELHTNFMVPVFYIQHGNASVYYPPDSKDIENKIIDHLHEQALDYNFFKIEDMYFMFSPVKNSSRTSGYLCLQINQENNSEFLQTVLDHAALAISQIILRSEISEERKRNTEVEIVQEFLYGRYHDQDKLNLLLPFSYKNAFFRVFVITINRENFERWHDWNEKKLRITLIIRKLFRENNLFPIISIMENEISIISFITSSDENESKMKYKKTINIISKDKELHELLGDEYGIGIGNNYNNLNEISRSYKEAKRVLELRQFNITKVLFHEEIGIYDVLFQLSSRKQIETFIQTHLGEILQSEPNTKEELLNTLEVFLDHNGSYKESSGKLYVVRQTLYHRIKKLRELLGEDFMESPNRLAIEFSLKAYRYYSVLHSFQ